MEQIIKQHNNLVAQELRRAEKGDFISLSDLLIAKEKIIKQQLAILNITNLN